MLDSDVVELIAEDSLQAESSLAGQREALEACLEEVPSEQRRLLARAYQGDAPIQQVAVASGRSVGGFYQWLYRMRQMLLECVKRRLAWEGSS